MLTQEEALDEFEDEDVDEDGKVSWEEHAAETYSIRDDDKSAINNLPEELQVLCLHFFILQRTSYAFCIKMTNDYLYYVKMLNFFLC